MKRGPLYCKSKFKNQKPRGITSKEKEREREREKKKIPLLLGNRFEVATPNQEGETLNGRLQLFLSSLLSSIGGVFGHSQEDFDMASRAAAPQQPRGKQKNVPAEGRNRRVLGDIGNLVSVPAVEGKPQTRISRPITRGYCAQLVANAEAAVENNKKPVAEIVNGAPAVKDDAAACCKAVVAQKKVPNEPKQETVTGASTKLEDEKIEDKADSERRLREGSSKKKKVKTFSAILTARSKAACRTSSSEPWDPIVNIDAGDVDDELAVVEYVDDIYKFYKDTEEDNRLHDYMSVQPDISSKMRSILVDWLIQVHRKFDLMPETLYLTINIVDRYLSVKIVSRKELQLVGISSMLIACKYEEIWAPEVNDFICISDNAYNRDQVLIMEKSILGKLEWHVTVPTPYVFLIRYIKASVPSDKEMENTAFFLAELGLMHYSTITLYCPSMIAASAVYAANCTNNKSPSWSKTLKHHTGYSEDQLMDCAKRFVSFHHKAAESKHKAAVYRKFSTPDRGVVALLPPAKSLLAEASLNS